MTVRGVQIMKRIMTVDDDEDILKMLKDALEAGGYLVETASSGEECLQKIGDFKPEVVLLDIMMPGMNCWEVLDELVKQGFAEKTHIAMLTAKPLTEEDINRSIFNRLVHYIRKPVTIPLLFQEIERVEQEECKVREEAEKISQSFGQDFAGSYHHFFQKASRQKRIFSGISGVSGPPKDIHPKDMKLMGLMESIVRVEYELQDMKTALKDLLQKKY